MHFSHHDPSHRNDTASDSVHTPFSSLDTPPVFLTVISLPVCYIKTAISFRIFLLLYIIIYWLAFCHASYIIEWMKEWTDGWTDRRYETMDMGLVIAWCACLLPAVAHVVLYRLPALLPLLIECYMRAGCAVLSGCPWQVSWDGACQHALWPCLSVHWVSMHHSVSDLSSRHGTHLAAHRQGPTDHSFLLIYCLSAEIMPHNGICLLFFAVWLFTVLALAGQQQQSHCVRKFGSSICKG